MVKKEPTRIRVKLPKVKQRPLRFRKDSKGRYIRIGRQKLYISTDLQKKPLKVLDTIKRLRISSRRKGKGWRLADPRATASFVATIDRDFLKNLEKTKKDVESQILKQQKAEVQNIEKALDAQGQIIPRPLKSTIFDINKSKDVEQIDKLIKELTKAISALPAPAPAAPAPPARPALPAPPVRRPLPPTTTQPTPIPQPQPKQQPKTQN